MDKQEIKDHLIGAARTALNCQDACNLSGVVFSYARTMQIMCDVSRFTELGTTWRNKHPINILFVDKIAQLSGYPQSAEYSVTKAYEDCEAMLEDSK